MQRILLSLIALGLALLISYLQEDGGAARDAAPPAMRGAPATEAPAPATETETGPSRGASRASSREQAVAQAVRWLQAQEGGAHHGHTIARHVGRSDAELHDRLERDGVPAASGFYDLETAAVAIARTIKHAPNDAQVRRWLDDDETRRRLALRRLFEKPIGRIVYRGGDGKDGRTAVAVLVKRTTDGRPGYRLLTAYVEP